jgi:hypothetical protein
MKFTNVKDSSVDDNRPRQFKKNEILKPFSKNYLAIAQEHEEKVSKRQRTTANKDISPRGNVTGRS